MDSTYTHRRGRHWEYARFLAPMPVAAILGQAALALVVSLSVARGDEEAPNRAGSVAGRAGYIAFETFGRTESITHVELLPYLQSGQHTLFNDTRFFMSDDGLFGGNVGLGYRYLLPEEDHFLGFSLWYDLDDTTGKTFQQLGLSLESCGTLWDVRSNLYLPIGDTEQDYSIRVTNQRFAGNQILLDGSRQFGEALGGFDLELGLPVPTPWGVEHDLRVTPGTYMFFGDVAPEIYGYKVRLEGNVARNVAMQVELTDDDTFGTTVNLGVAFTFPGGPRVELSDEAPARVRTDQFVRRNYNVIVSRQEDLRMGLTAINPDTGLPYEVQHVSSASGGGNLGTVEDPFHTIADAQAADGDIIFVHGDSVLSAPIVMEANDWILGEGVDHSIVYDGFGTSLLPTVNSSTTRPTLLGVSGTAVTLASDSRLSGFILDSPTAHGIMGNAVGNVAVRHVDVLSAGQDGVFLQGGGTGNTFYDLAISNAMGVGIHIDGGAPEVSFNGTLDNGAGRAVVLENTTGGNVDLAGMDIADDGGDGLLLDNMAGDASFGDVRIENGTNGGVAIQDTTGDFAFESLRIDAVTGAPGVSIVDSAGTGSFGSLAIATNGGTGFYVLNGGTLTIDSGSIAATGAAALNLESASLTASLTSLASSGGTYGLRLVDHTGLLLVTGSDAYGTGGLIQGATTGVLLNNAGTVGLKYMDLDSNIVGAETIDTDHFALSMTRITDSTSHGIDAINTGTLEIVDSIFTGNGGSGDNSIRARYDVQGDYTISITGSTVTDDSLAGLSIASLASGTGSSLTLALQENAITTSGLGADGVRLAWNGSVLGSIVSNAFVGTGGSNTGLAVTGNSTTELLQIAAVSNTFEFSGGNDTGMQFTSLGPSTLSLGANSIEFNGASGVGMAFDLAASADAYLYDNVITDNVSGATGIQFDSIVGASNVTLQGNTIDLLSSTAIIDRGIIFTSVTGTVTLVNPSNNIVNGATTAFFAPVGSLSGYTYVNGATVP